MSAHLSAAQIKARLDHPIIDADGHWIEYGPVFTEELRRVGGEDAVEGWNAVRNGSRVSRPWPMGSSGKGVSRNGAVRGNWS